MLKLGILLAIGGICWSSVSANALQLGLTTTSTPALPTSTQSPTATSDSLRETQVISKRDLKAADGSSASTNGVGVKNYDPPPEYYRGPGSAGHLASTSAPSYYGNFKPSDGFSARPVTFPSNHHGGGGGGGDGGQPDNSDLHSAANNYNSWQHLKGKVGAAVLNKNKALQDRISVASGHYTNSEHASSAYEGRPYGGQTPHAEYLPSNSYYNSRPAPSAHTTGYYGASSAAEGIPFDVYGSRNHYPPSTGSDYASYPYSDVAELATHKTHPDKALLVKSFLIPLASAAVLGIAAALASNPLLLQLGTVSGIAPAAAVYGKRKKRDLATATTPFGGRTHNLNRALTSGEQSRKDSKLLPYRGHHQQQEHHRQ